MYYDDLRYFFSNKLKELIKKKGITQQALADAADSSKTTISRYVNGQALPSYYTLFKLAEALDCSVQDFFPGGLS